MGDQRIMKVIVRESTWGLCFSLVSEWDEALQAGCMKGPVDAFCIPCGSHALETTIGSLGT